MKLYTSLTSPYGRKVRAVALEKAIEVELVLVESPFFEVVRLNPIGQIPTLERDDGSILFDSGVIAEYLDRRSEPALRGEGEARIAIGVWNALADGLVEATMKRMVELQRKPEAQSRAFVRHAEGKIKRILAHAEDQIGDGYLVRDTFSFADVALACALDYLDLRYPHPWRERAPRLAAYGKRLLERPSLRQTRPPTQS